MDSSEQKRAAAAAALAWLEPRLQPDQVLGIGTGSTADHFIDLLAPHRARFAGAVASSGRSAERLSRLGVRVFDLNDIERLPVYIDGADEINERLEMIKGGGGALTREKIVAAAAEVFVCIADASKRVVALGKFPLPVEVIPMARAQVCRAIRALSRQEGLGEPIISVRTMPDGHPFVTDNGNWIVDVAGLTIAEPQRIEPRIGGIVGIVESGLFALRGADLLLLAGAEGVAIHERPH
jgi:ribose 5-phosphate isomerase A